MNEQMETQQIIIAQMFFSTTEQTLYYALTVNGNHQYTQKSPFSNQCYAR